MKQILGARYDDGEEILHIQAWRGCRVVGLRQRELKRIRKLILEQMPRPSQIFVHLLSLKAAECQLAPLQL